MRRDVTAIMVISAAATMYVLSLYARYLSKTIFGISDSLDNEGHQTYVELRKLASAMSIWRTTLAVSGHLSLAWLTRNR